MREVVIQIHCDVCGTSLTEENVCVVTLTVGSMTYEADLCPADLSVMSDPMRPVENKKRRSPAKAGTVGPHACSFCDKRFTKPAGLTRHVNQSHQTL